MIKISVVMSVFNSEDTLKDAIDSILNQTFRDFEFLIINDGSSDSTEAILRSYKDGRIRLIDNKKNIGLAASLNKGIKLSKGKYIARMDADDVSLPERLEVQFNFMELHPEINLCGGSVKLFNGKVWNFPTYDSEIKCSLLFANAFAHPTVIFSKVHFMKNNLYYDSTFKRSQDYDLWVKAMNNSRFHNIRKVLLLYSVSAEDIQKHFLKKEQEYPSRVRSKQLSQLGIVSPELIKIHELISTHGDITKKTFKSINQHLNMLIKSNHIRSIYPKHEFDRFILKIWLSAVKQFVAKGKLKEIYGNLMMFPKESVLYNIYKA